MTNTDLSQFNYQASIVSDKTSVQTFGMSSMVAFGPTTAMGAENSSIHALVASQSIVSVQASQISLLVAYGTGEPFDNRQTAWTFTLDGHKFYVLPLGAEGDWAYDATTGSWCQLQTDGFSGLNFTHGVMWGPRIMGGDLLYPYLYELDPNQKLDEDWRTITHIVTGGIPLRGRYNVGVSNFTLTASVADLQEVNNVVTLNFSDDNGVTYSPDFDIELTGVGTQDLIWNSLGSFSAPGRVFKITDQAGPMRIDGADVVLNGPVGADSGIE